MRLAVLMMIACACCGAQTCTYDNSIVNLECDSPGCYAQGTSVYLPAISPFPAGYWGNAELTEYGTCKATQDEVSIYAPIEWAGCANNIIGSLQGSSEESITIDGATSTMTITGYLQVNAEAYTTFGFSIWSQITLQYCGSGEPVSLYQTWAPC
jgi:hypothetical protein